jgi:hypothetical protein
MFKKFITMGVGAIILASSAAAFSANPPELRSVRIPAAMCQPSGNMYDIPKSLQLNDNKWVLNGDGTQNTITAMLVCPIPVSEISVNTDGPGNYIESMKFIYKDPDAGGSKGRVQIELRSMSQFWNRSLAYFDSHTVPTSYVLNYNFPLNNTVIMKRDEYYFVRVTLTKGPGFGSPEFWGISFP